MTYIPLQWHLGDESDNNRASAHVLGAWSRGYFGSGTTIAVVDDGLDGRHPDMSPGFDAARSVNLNAGGGRDPTPRGDESHGTGAAGVAAAAGVNSPPGSPSCGHGVAPRARLVGIRATAEAITDADEARALSHERATVDVYSCSWGPLDDGTKLEGPGSLANAAIASGARAGCTYAWAAGNGGASTVGDTCAHDGYVASPDVIAVGALAHNGRAAPYSEGCPALFVCAPSSGAGWGITTQDIVGSRGAAITDCRADFGGTSAAAPFVAGVMALVVSANDKLSNRDIYRVLRASARRVDTDDAGWTRNAAGIWHHDIYGFGLVDAEASVLLAVDTDPMPQSRERVAKFGPADACCRTERTPGTPRPATSMASVCSQTVGPFPCAIPDHPQTVSSTVSQPYMMACIVVDCESADFIVERVVATVTATHRRRSDVAFHLESPGGSLSTFRRRPYDRGTTFQAWNFTSVVHWGERACGTWCLYAEDCIYGSTGTLSWFSIVLIGHA
jgi:kexin